MNTIICYVGGSSRGNPGPAAVGVYITDADGEMQSESAQTIGNAKNNFAEYYAVMFGLQTLVTMLGEDSKTKTIELRLDSELVKKQLNSEQPINEPGLVPLFIEIHNLRVANFPQLTFTQISSDKNNEVYRLVNEALDSRQ